MILFFPSRLFLVFSILFCLGHYFLLMFLFFYSKTTLFLVPSTLIMYLLIYHPFGQKHIFFHVIPFLVTLFLDELIANTILPFLFVCVYIFLEKTQLWDICHFFSSTFLSIKLTLAFLNIL